MDGKEIYEQIYVKTLIAACHSGRTGRKPDLNNFSWLHCKLWLRNVFTRQNKKIINPYWLAMEWMQNMHTA